MITDPEHQVHPIFRSIEQENLTEIRSRYLNPKIINDPPLQKLTNPTDLNQSILHAAANINSYELLSDIITYLKANLSQEEFIQFINQKTSQGTVALHYAAFKGNIKIIMLLISNGADYTIRTNAGLTVVHYGAQGNQPNTLVYFHLKYSMRLDEPDNSGSTPLHWAAYLGSEASTSYLLGFNWNHEIDINVQDNRGLTPLHLTTFKKEAKIAQRLLQKGASPNILDKQKRDVFRLANEKQAYAISLMLKENKKCQLCAFKAPVKQIKHPHINQIILITMQLISIALVLLIFIPTISKKFESCLIPQIYFFTFMGTTLLYFFTFFYLVCSNPGVYKKNKFCDIIKLLETFRNLQDFCPVCLVEIRRLSKHCVICNNCVDDFDHHCYWVNNCIGTNNYCMFIFFLMLSIIDMLVIMVGCVSSLIYNSAESLINGCEANQIFILFSYIQQIPIYDTVFKNDKNIILYAISGTFVVIVLVFLIPVILLSHCHCKNACARLKKYKCCKKRKKLNEIAMTETLNEISSFVLSEKEL